MTWPVFRRADRIRIVADGRAGTVADPARPGDQVLVVRDDPGHLPPDQRTLEIPRTELEHPPECRVHGYVGADHFPCQMPGETPGLFAARCFGEHRDV